MKKRGNISIKAKLLGVITPVVIAIVVVLVLVSYLASAHIIENYSQHLLESSVENQTSKIESWLDENLSSFQMAKTTIEQLNPDDAQLQTILDSYYGYSDNYPDGLYVSDSNGNLLKASKSTKSESSPTKSTWYTEGLTRVNMTIGSAYKNAEGVNVISASGILKDNSDRIRVISADMTLDRISIIVNSFIEMDDAQKFERAENFLHVYSSKEAEESYTVRCSIIQPGQQSLFDNEHTVYETVKVGEADGVLGTSTDEHGKNVYTLSWEYQGITHTVMGNIPYDEIMKIAEGIR